MRVPACGDSLVNDSPRLHRDPGVSSRLSWFRSRYGYPHLGVDDFVKEYEARDKMTSDGAQKKTGRKNKPHIELWEDLAGDDEIFHE